jgi:hypothetical protein
VATQIMKLWRSQCLAKSGFTKKFITLQFVKRYPFKTLHALLHVLLGSMQCENGRTTMAKNITTVSTAMTVSLGQS